jgi:hypothetical protein
MAGVALLCEHGADLGLKEIGINGTRYRLSKQSRCCGSQENKATAH